MSSDSESKVVVAGRSAEDIVQMIGEWIINSEHFAFLSNQNSTLQFFSFHGCHECSLEACLDQVNDLLVFLRVLFENSLFE